MHYKGITLREHQGEWFFEDHALAESHDPKGAERQKREAWMERMGAVESRARLCLGQVAYGRGHKCGHCYGRFVCDKPVCQIYQSKQYPWFDHSKLFWLPGRQAYALTAQPYGVSLEKVQEMEAFAETNGMEVDVSIQDAWWYPGLTPLIVWTRRQEESDEEQ